MFRVSSLVSPFVYLAILWIVYFSAMLESPLSWHRNIVVDSRYLDVYLVYTFSFLMGIYSVSVASLQKMTLRYDNWGFPSLVGKRLTRAVLVLSWIVIAFCAARLLAMGTIPLFYDLSARYTLNKLGGFVDYTASLANILCLINFYLYLISRSKKHILVFALLFALVASYFRRQDILEVVLGLALIVKYRTKLNIRKTIIFSAVSLIAFYLGIGGLAVWRAGADVIAPNIDLFTLPFWVAIGDLSGAVKFGHLATDLIGPGGLGGIYSFGVFLSAFTSGAVLHGAGLLAVMLTDAETAQSINAPLSYYLDGGYFGVISIGAITGAFSHWIWKKSITSPNLGYGFAHFLIFSQLLWSIRSGNFIFGPFTLYALSMIAFLFYNRAEGPSTRDVFSQPLGMAFLAMLTICCIGMVIRLPFAL